MNYHVIMYRNVPFSEIALNVVPLSLFLFALIEIYPFCFPPLGEGVLSSKM